MEVDLVAVHLVADPLGRRWTCKLRAEGRGPVTVMLIFFVVLPASFSATQEKTVFSRTPPCFSVTNVVFSALLMGLPLKE